MKENETLVELSEDKDEWYQHWFECLHCECAFMVASKYVIKYCPGCGRKIIGSRCGNRKVFYFEGDDDGRIQNEE